MTHSSGSGGARAGKTRTPCSHSGLLYDLRGDRTLEGGCYGRRNLDLPARQ